MKKLLLGAGVLILAVLLWLVFRPGAGHATPGECVQTYFKAIKSADAAAYLKCLDERLRGEVEQQFATPEALAEFLRARGHDLRNWVVEEPQVNGGQATVWVQQQYSTGLKRQKLVLQQTSTAWHITALEKAQDMPSDIPYDTHISKAP